jgi:hypothetical protein
MSQEINRREFIRDSLVASTAGALGLSATARGASASAPSSESAVPARTSTATEGMPMGKLTGQMGSVPLSRLVLGCNHITHFVHCRDLRYVNELAMHYNTEAKIIETMALAEQHGVNTIMMHNDPRGMPIVNRYINKHGGRIQRIVAPDPYSPEIDFYSEQIRRLADEGVSAMYVHGVHAERFLAEGNGDMIARIVEAIRVRGQVPAGVAAHDLAVVEYCEKHDVGAEFYVKTFHHHNYPSAPRPDQLTGVISEVPGYWCKDPKATIDVMNKIAKPFIAYKVLAAGAIPPQSAFQYAFENGADHVLVGMFDFEIAEDAQITREILSKMQRSRPWRS